MQPKSSQELSVHISDLDESLVTETKNPRKLSTCEDLCESVITLDKGPSFGLEPKTYALRKHGCHDEKLEKRSENKFSPISVAPQVAQQSPENERESLTSSEVNDDRSFNVKQVAQTSARGDFLSAINRILSLPLNDLEKAECIRRLLAIGEAEHRQ